jgi:sigma-B regulation protein RsbU (phosphoserine phosphatase)
VVGQLTMARRLRILLYEEQPDAARQIIDALKSTPAHSHMVIHEESLDDAIERLELSTSFDAALVGLPGIDHDGLGALAKLQAASPELPIILLADFDDSTWADRALMAGAQDCIERQGITGERLLRAVQFAVVRKSAELERQGEIDRLTFGLVAENKRINDELSAARTMQFDLLPDRAHIEEFAEGHRLVMDSYFEPSLDIGGDLWGCATSWDGNPVFYSFDFSGHGVAAALNVFRLHALMRELDGKIADPAETLAHLNDMLCSLLPKGQYATIFLAILDTRYDKLIWSAGGAPPPMLFSPDGEAVLLDTRGKPLGIAKSARYVNRAAEFPASSSLVLYSDAVTEARVDEQTMLGEEHLMLMARDFHSASGVDLPGLVNRLFNTVGSPLDDDMTVVSITRLAGAVQRRGDRQAGFVLEEGTRPKVQLGPWVLVSRRIEAIAEGLAEPYRGFVEAGGAGEICLLAAERNGIGLSVTVRSAWSASIVGKVVAAARQRFAGQRDWDSIELCLAEAVSNAVIHGSLAIDSGLRETKEGLLRYNAAVEAGLSDPAIAGKRIELAVIPLPDGQLEITVSDQGTGFDLSPYLDAGLAAGAKRGRGLVLIRKVARSMTSRDQGRTLVITL